MATKKAQPAEATDDFDRNAAIKLRHKLEESRKKASAALKGIEEQIKELDEKIIESLEASDEERVEIKGNIGVRLTRSTVPSIEDWDEFWAYIKKNNASHMIEKRVGVTAYREQLALGKQVPGIKPFNKVKVVLTK